MFAAVEVNNNDAVAVISVDVVAVVNDAKATYVAVNSLLTLVNDAAVAVVNIVVLAVVNHAAVAVIGAA